MEHLSIQDPAQQAATQTSSLTYDPPVAGDPLQKFSCVVCSRRKVRCDRRVPCSNCSKTGASCEYREPPPPQRRKRGKVETKHETEADLRHKIARYEGLLGKLGVDVRKERQHGQNARPAEFKEGNQEAEDCEKKFPAPIPELRGKLLVTDGEARYVENNMVVNISEEFGEEYEPSLDDFDDNIGSSLPFPSSPHMEDAILGYPVNDINLTQFHPTPERIRWLWQMFQENVDPLTKLVHIPSTQKQIFAAMQNLSHVEKDLEALMFAVYCCTVNSLTDQQCQTFLGMPLSTAFSTYQYASTQALIKAKFLGTSKFATLQAMVLFITSVRTRWDHDLVWIMTGLVHRLGQRMGLHRDGTFLKLDPFETEMRRRVWRYIVQVDAMVTEYSGPGHADMSNMGDTKIPRNLDDSEFWPGMTELPDNREGASDIMFLLMRYEISTKIISLKRDPGPSDSDHRRRKLAEVDGFEKHLELKYFRYCQPLKPAHMMGSVIGRAAILAFRVAILHPRWHMGVEPPSLSESEQELLFSCRHQFLEYYCLIASNESVHRFAWHYKSTFHYDYIIFILNTLRHKTTGIEADRAWTAVEGVFECNLDLMQRRTKPLHRAICRLALKAWEAREHDASGPLQVPKLIKNIRIRYPNSIATSPDPATFDATPTDPMGDFADPNAIFGDGAMNIDSLDWSQWEKLFEEERQMDMMMNYDAVQMKSLGQMGKMGPY